MTRPILPVLMSGGAGTRLWPLSIADRPKQFHALGSGADTMIQATARRLSGETAGVRFLPPVVIGHHSHAGLIVEQLDAVAPPQAVLLEPEGRNTAATALLAALIAQAIAPEALVFLAPSDHLIADAEAFRAILAAAAPLAQDRIVTLGVTPDRPATGYGYIQKGEPLGEKGFAISAFKEKPPLAEAEAFLAAGDWVWNAGMFFFAPGVVLEEFAAVPQVALPVTEAFAARRIEGRLQYLPHDPFTAAKAMPFDVAVMERTKRGAVAPCGVGWADVGSFAELWRLSDKDAAGVAGRGAFAVEDAQDCFILAEGAPVGLIGVSGLAVVATPNGVLVTRLDRAEEVRLMAARLASGPPKAPS